jgi:UDP-2,3-diacylglucosamine hydrolase
MPAEKKIYFLSDSHLGVPDKAQSRFRENLMVKWFDQYAHTAKEIYLLGDIFDFWFEYRRVVPKGYVRLLGKIAEIADRGIPVHYFTGNHDMWAFDYFEKELGVIIHRKNLFTELSGKKFCIGHGDGLGSGDTGYKLLKIIFSCRFCQKLFAFLHPGFGIGMAEFFSKKSRIANQKTPEVFVSEDKESLVHYCRDILRNRNVDFFVFGHRHLPLNIEVVPGVHYVNTGDWVTHFTFAEFDGETIDLKTFKPDKID